MVKHENHTPTGAFKVRGGIVYVDRLKRERPQVKGVITATRGNHGQSLAFACGRAGIACTVVVPFGNSTEKNAAMQAFGAELIEHGRDFDEARERAAEIARSAATNTASRSTRIWCSASRPMRMSCSAPSRSSMRCSCRSGSAPASAA